MLLKAIWQASLVLSLLSIAVLLSLIVRRIIIQSIEARLERRRAEIKSQVLRYISSETPPAWTEPIRNPDDERILLGIATSLLQSVSGTMRTRILTLLNTAISIDRMLAILRRGKPVDRAKVAARLFWSKDPTVHAELRHALSDPSPEVVLAAAGSLLEAGQHIDLAALVPKLKDRDMLDHRGVRELLRRLAPRNSAAIIAMLTGDDYHAATLAADAVGASSDPAVIRTLRTVASLHRDKDVRAAAIRALGNAGDREASPTIAAALNDPSWEVRVQATIAAGRLRLVHLAPQLAEALGDDNWWLQWRAAQALAKLGPAGEGLLRQIPFDSPVAVLADVALAEVHSA